MMASVGQVSAHAPQDTQVESREAGVEPGGDVGLEAAAGGGEREGALDLVAGAHAAPAGDAQLVLQGQVGVALVVARRVRARPFQRGSPIPKKLGDLAPARCARPGGSGSSVITSSTVAAATRRAVASLGVRPPCRRGTAWCRRRSARPRPPCPPCRRGRRRTGAMRSSKQSVGHVAAGRAAPPRARWCPPRPPARCPSTVTFIAGSSRVVFPALLRAAQKSSSGPFGPSSSLVSGCSGPLRPSSSGKCSIRLLIGAGMPPRARRGSPARASRAAPRASSGRPAPGASTISNARWRPIRHGKHLPQLS